MTKKFKDYWGEYLIPTDELNFLDPSTILERIAKDFWNMGIAAAKERECPECKRRERRKEDASYMRAFLGR